MSRKALLSANTLVANLLLAAALLVFSSAAYTTTFNFLGTGHNWPSGDTGTPWQAFKSMNDEVNGITNGAMDFIGNSTYPGFYYATTFDTINDVSVRYLNFRFRVNLATLTVSGDNTNVDGSLFIMIDTNNDGDPNYAFAWDARSDSNTSHGLEMMFLQPGPIATTWYGTQFDDLDLNGGQKLAVDINGDGRKTDGYIRLEDQVEATGLATTTGQKSTFIDIAVSCNYLDTTSNRTPTEWAAISNQYPANFDVEIRCGTPQTWGLQLGSIANATDHNPITTDVAGGFAPADTGLSWPVGPTQASVSSFRGGMISGRPLIEWQTGYEIGTLGFYLERFNDKTGNYEPLNDQMLPALIQSAQGGIYRFVDDSAEPGRQYSYRLVEQEADGEQTVHGPFEVRMAGRMSGDLPANGFEATAAPVDKKTVQRTAAARTANQDAKRNRSKRAGATAKLEVTENGLAELSAKEIADLLGMHPNEAVARIRTGNFALSSQGKDVAWLPTAKNQGIYFYGEQLDTPYTGSNIYWLEPKRGSVMAQNKATCGVLAGYPTHFTESQHFEESAWMRLIEGTDYWNWDYVYNPYSPEKTFDFTLPDVSAGVAGNASLAIKLRGGSDASTSGDDHDVAVELNGSRLGTYRFNGQTAFDLEVAFPQSLLVDGPNQLTLRAQALPNVPYSLVFLDSFDIRYQRALRAEDGVLEFALEDAGTVLIDGFADKETLLFDITNPKQPVYLAKAVGKDGLCFESPGASRFVALEPGKVKPVEAAWADSPSNLHKGQAKYLIVATPEVEAGAQRLAEYRESLGLSSRVVLLEDILDEFSSGIYEPDAIARFLEYASQNWKTPPRYVLLAGSGTYDYRDYLGHGTNLIPPLLVKNEDGLFPSDSILGDIDGDGVQEMAVGRLPVIDDDEMQALVDKIIAYETAGPSPGYGVVMLADNIDGQMDFAADSVDVAGGLPDWIQSDMILLDDLDTDSARGLLLKRLSEGAYLLNYVGHGRRDQFASEGLLKPADVDDLILAPGRQPVVSAMTCLAGDFAWYASDSITEQLVLKADGGAIATFAPTGFSYNHDARKLDQAVFSAIFDDSEDRLGDAVLNATQRYMEQGGRQYLLPLYGILGDPALSLH